MKVGQLLPTGNKLSKLFWIDLESRIQFWPKLSIALQCHKIKLTWRFFGSNYLPFWEIKAINSETWTLFACWKQIDKFFLCLFGKQGSVLAESLRGPSVSQNKTPVKVFWFRQFTFQTKENNKIWNFDPFWPAGNKLTNFFFAYLECRIQFWLKVCMALQCHKIKLLWKFLCWKTEKSLLVQYKSLFFYTNTTYHNITYYRCYHITILMWL